MKKRLVIMLIAIILALSLAGTASATQVTALGSGYTNVPFSNGYFGYCIDHYLTGAYSNDVFYEHDTSIAKNNIDNSDISQYLKVFFTQYFEDFFESDGNGGYVIKFDKKDTVVPAVIYHFSDNEYVWGTNPGDRKYYTENVKAYTGPEIPDEGYTITISNGDKITFYFMCLEPENTDQQTFFAYKIAVNEPATHTHDYSDDWKSDEDEHWHECECGDKQDKAEHTEEIRNDVPATEFTDGYTGDTYCSECDKLLEEGTVIPATHTHDYSDDWKSDEDEHWHECECGDKQDKAEHIYEDGECSVCGKVNDKDDDDNDSDKPVINLPDIELPDITLPDIELPDITLPDINIPDISLPDIQLPDINWSEIELPEINFPDISLPDIQLPNIDWPEFELPDINFPEADEPEADEPEADEPEADEPEADKPEAETPESDTITDNPEIPNTDSRTDSGLWIIFSSIGLFALLFVLFNKRKYEIA